MEGIIPVISCYSYASLAPYAQRRFKAMYRQECYPLFTNMGKRKRRFLSRTNRRIVCNVGYKIREARNQHPTEHSMSQRDPDLTLSTQDDLAFLVILRKQPASFYHLS